MADRPSERRRPGPPTPDLAGTEPGTPSTHARGQGGRDAAKSFSDTPQGMVARPAKRQAAVGGAAEQGVLRAPRAKVMAPGCEPGRPAPPLITSGGTAAAGPNTLAGGVSRSPAAPTLDDETERAAASPPPLWGRDRVGEIGMNRADS